MLLKDVPRRCDVGEALFFLPPSSRMLPTPHRHQFLEEALAFRTQRSGFYLLHLKLRPVQPLVMLVGKVTGFKDMSFEGFVIIIPTFLIIHKP